MSIIHCSARRILLCQVLTHTESKRCSRAVAEQKEIGSYLPYHTVGIVLAKTSPSRSLWSFSGVDLRDGVDMALETGSGIVGNLQRSPVAAAVHELTTKGSEVCIKEGDVSCAKGRCLAFFSDTQLTACNGELMNCCSTLKRSLLVQSALLVTSGSFISSRHRVFHQHETLK